MIRYLILHLHILGVKKKISTHKSTKFEKFDAWRLLSKSTCHWWGTCSYEWTIECVSNFLTFFYVGDIYYKIFLQNVKNTFKLKGRQEIFISMWNVLVLIETKKTYEYRFSAFEGQNQRFKQLNNAKCWDIALKNMI